MALQFASASAEYLTTAPPVTAAPLTMHCWFYLDLGTQLHRMVSLNIGGGAESPNSFQLYVGGAGVSYALAAQTGGSTARSLAGVPASGAWHAGGAVFHASNSRFCWLNGTEATENTTDVTPAGIDTLNICRANLLSTSYGDFQIAEFGLWNVALTDAEMLALAAGVSPLLVRPTGLVSYVPAIRDSAAVRDWKGNAWTIGGTPVDTAHPRVFNRKRSNKVFIPAATGTGYTGAGWW